MNSLQFQQVANIKVFGIGGGGCNAVKRMVNEGVQGVEFYVANTDMQVVEDSPVMNKIVLGRELTKGLGAGGNPEVGRKAAQETESEIREAIKGADMVFITAGMGGGTGTGAAPLFAKIAKEEGALTVAIVTKPFSFEGKRRYLSAMEGLEELKQYVDSLIIVSNNNVLEVIGRRPILESFQAADNVLRQGVQTITDLIAVPALINLDFADVRSVMSNQGTALIGIGMAEGEDKARAAAEKAIQSPLLEAQIDGAKNAIINITGGESIALIGIGMAEGEDKARAAAEKAIQSPLLEAQIDGAKNAIINITGGESITLFDAEDATSLIREAAGNDIDTIFGVAINPNLGDAIIVTVIATGFDEKDDPLYSSGKSANPVSRPQMVTERKEVKKDVRVDDADSIIPNFFNKR